MPGQRERDLLLFEDLMTRHVDIVFHVAHGWTGDSGEAEDLVQVAFIKSWRAFGRFEAGTNFKAWILKILRNSFVDSRRGPRARRETVSLDRLSSRLEPSEPVPPPQAIDLETKEIFYDVFSHDIARLLRQVPRELQLPVLLFEVEGLRYREVADVLDLPLGTVRSRIHRGRSLFAELLKDYARDVGYLREQKR